MKAFNYGKISISRRVSENTPVERESTVIDKVIKIVLTKTRKAFINESFWETKILYVDENGIRQYDSFYLEEYQVGILTQGDMTVEI